MDHDIRHHDDPMTLTVPALEGATRPVGGWPWPLFLLAILALTVLIW